MTALKVSVVSRRGEVPSPSNRVERPDPARTSRATTFMVLGVPLEHEWLVPKLGLGIPFTSPS